MRKPNGGAEERSDACAKDATGQTRKLPVFLAAFVCLRANEHTGCGTCNGTNEDVADHVTRRVAAEMHGDCFRVCVRSNRGVNAHRNRAGEGCLLREQRRRRETYAE
jgi:hypothetical protein